MIVALMTSRPRYELHDWLFDNKCQLVNYRGDGYYHLGVSFNYLERIPAEHVNTHTWINFHPGPLPELRGRNVAYRAIMEGRNEFGATLHYMDANYDTGDIIECRRFEIVDSYCAGDLVRIANDLLVDMFYEYMPRFLAGEDVPATPQPDRGAYTTKGEISDLIVMNADQKRLIRALTVPGRYYACTDIGGRRYRIVPEVDCD